MIIKDSYAKKFELALQQEIQNHQDSILNMNIAINAANAKIVELNELANKRMNKLESQILEKDMMIKRLEESLKSLSKLSDSYMNDTERFKSGIKEEVRCFVDKSISAQSKAMIVENLIQNLSDNVSKVEKGIVSLGLVSSQEIKDAEFRFLEKLHEMKKSILEIPSEAKFVKEEIEKRLDIDRVDFDGLMREVDMVKKIAFIADKHIEKLFNEIEKLKVR